MSRTVVLSTTSVVVGLVAACMAALVVASVSPEKAEAAFPGRNGAIAYVSAWWVSMGGNEYERHYVHRVNPDGTKVRRLTDDVRVGVGAMVSPSWSPDGKKIAFSAQRGGTYGLDVYLMNADGTGETNLTNDPEVNNTYPAFYPSGRKIVYVGSRPDGNDYGLYSLSFDAAGQATGPPTRLTHNGDVDPALSPDGKKIAFSATRGEGWGNYWEIWKMRADGTRATQVTKNSSYSDRSPDWQPRP